MSKPNFMAMHPIVVEIFQSGPKWWTDQPTPPCVEPYYEPYVTKK